MTRDFEFTDGDTRYGGIVFDRGQPHTVLALPDWRGFQTDYARRRGTELSASLNCNVIVSDLYGLAYRPTAYSGDAEVWISRALGDPLALRARLARYFSALCRATRGEPGRMSVVGYCLGGALSFEAGRAAIGLKTVVSVHGIPSADAPVAQGETTTTFVAIHGGSDPIIGMDQLAAFQEEMTSAEVDWVSIALGHARHGFTNEEIDPHGAFQRFDPVAARRCLDVLKLYLPGENAP